MRNKPLPIEPIGKIKPVSSIEGFFGFVEAEITCPKSVKIPVLPCKTNGRTIYPTGSWKGVYFSEILKAAIARGYQITPIRGLEFTKGNPFNEYIDDFYSIKALAKGAQRGIAKLHLNTLYGAFARKVQTLKTMIVDNDKLNTLLLNNIVKSVLVLSPNVTLVLVDLAGETSNAGESFNTTVEKDHDKFLAIKSNVAIAAAITAYGQIELMPIKDLGIVKYSDTDSVVTDKPLPAEFIGQGLGQWKDELDGGIITRAYFLGIKKYCYEYQDRNGAIHCKSIFTGVPRNSLTFDEVESIVKGTPITKVLNNRFVRDNQKLSITIKPAKVTIQFNCHKELSGNNYLPPHVNLLRVN